MFFCEESRILQTDDMKEGDQFNSNPNSPNIFIIYYSKDAYYNNFQAFFGTDIYSFEQTATN